MTAAGSGLSEQGLARMHDVMAGHVERGMMPGLITLVARRGVPHVDVIGTKAFGDREPMPRRAIFRCGRLARLNPRRLLDVRADDAQQG